MNIKKNFLATILVLALSATQAFASTVEEVGETLDDEATTSENELDIGTEDNTPTYLTPVINIPENIAIQKSTIFDASRSFLPDPDADVTYTWNFGDGNQDEGIEVPYSYQEPGHYTVKLTVNDGNDEITVTKEIFAYRKLILMISDDSNVKERIEKSIQDAQAQGVLIELIESYGSSTEFISEEVLSQKMKESSKKITEADQILIWTKANAGLNALSRFMQSSREEEIILNDKTITIIDNDVNRNISRIQRQFDLIKPRAIIVVQEGARFVLIESQNDDEFINTLDQKGYDFQLVNSKTRQFRLWNFMSYFVNILIDSGIPDNTIALLLLLPVIATVVAFMRQVIGITTYGLYTPTIITLSFLVIGISAGLLTLFTAVIVAAVVRTILKKVRMLFIPKMAIVITAVSLSLLILLIISIYFELFDAEFISLAIFPMLILSTLVEKFVSTKTGKGLSSAIFLMTSTIIVALIAYFIAGGEINLGFTQLKMESVKNLMLNYPEIILLLLILNIILGKWTGLRVMEIIRFREILRHTEE